MCRGVSHTPFTTGKYALVRRNQNPFSGEIHLIPEHQGVCDTPLHLFNYNQMEIPKTKHLNTYIDPDVMTEEV